jgi:hypothetical protein
MGDRLRMRAIADRLASSGSYHNNEHQQALPDVGIYVDQEQVWYQGDSRRKQDERMRRSKKNTPGSRVMGGGGC